MNDTILYEIKELNPDMIAPTSARINEPDYGGSKTVIIGKPGCFTKGTKILMFDGSIKNVENIEIGNVIMGDDSTSRFVLELCRDQDEMFEIIPDNNSESYTVNKQHKLVLKTNINFNNYKVGEIYEVTVEDYLKQTNEFKSFMNIYKTPVEFPEINLDINIQDINLSSNIPDKYKINSRKNRIIILNKLIDRLTDSIFYDNNHNYLTCYFNNINFSEDFIFICRSLGFLAIKIEATGQENMFIYQIYGDIQSLNLKNYNIQNNKTENNILSTNFKVKSKGQGDYYGFTLNGNHRFLLSTFDVVRNTGKSTLIAGLLYSKKHIFPVGIAFSGSEDSNSFFRKIMPSTFVFNEYNDDQIKSFIKRQKIAKQHLENPWAVMILDDCTDDPRIFNTPLQQGLFKRSRHWKCWYILSLQYGMDIKPVIRTNVDNVFLMREPSLRNRKIIWENYASIIPDFTIFCTLMDNVTSDHTALYIHNQGTSNEWKDCVFWYKAPLTPKEFKFGCDEYYQFHNERFNQDYVDPFDKF